MTTVCRFAPSPTGLLHVGGARTALFNWAFARHVGGQFLLRIEDTDRERSTAANEEAIIAALDWLQLQPDGEIVRQSTRTERYRTCAQQLLEEGKAYRCFATPAELDELRAEQEARGEKPRYDRRWRERTDHPSDQPYCIRFATSLAGETKLSDLVRGTVTMANGELDDLVILRADGTATYNFAAVVDDINMGITHVIRGEDHLTNTVRQVQIHQALTQTLPEFAHLPLILGRKFDEAGKPASNADGEPIYERLSKRNLAVDVDHYRQAGYLPEGLVNYLAQLGWTQPDTEIYTPAELAAVFELTKVNNSPARFNLERLRWINQQHLRRIDPSVLAALTGIDAPSEAFVIASEKAHTIVEIQEDLAWLQPLAHVPEDLGGQLRDDNQAAFTQLCNQLAALSEFTAEVIKGEIKACCKQHNLGFARLGMPLRVALTGKEQSPDVAHVAQLLGQDETTRRLSCWTNGFG